MRLQLALQGPSSLSLVRCEVMSLKLLYFCIDYRPSCEFMWAAGFFSCSRELSFTRASQWIESVCSTKNADNSTTQYLNVHMIPYSDVIRQTKNTPKTHHRISIGRESFFLLCLRALRFFFSSSRVLHPKMKYNPIFIAFYCYMHERIFKTKMLCWCNDDDGERSERKIQEGSTTRDTIFALRIPG